MGHFDPYSDFNRKQRSGISKKGGTAALFVAGSMLKQKISRIFSSMRKTSEALMIFLNC